MVGSSPCCEKFRGNVLNRGLEGFSENGEPNLRIEPCMKGGIKVDVAGLTDNDGCC